MKVLRREEHVQSLCSLFYFIILRETVNFASFQFVQGEMKWSRLDEAIYPQYFGYFRNKNVWDDWDIFICHISDCFYQYNPFSTIELSKFTKK